MNKEMIKQQMKKLENENRENAKKFNKKYDSNWKRESYSEWGLLKAKLEGYKLAENDFKEIIKQLENCVGHASFIKKIKEIKEKLK